MLTPHLPATAAVLIVLAGIAAAVLVHLGREWRAATVAHELQMVREHVAAGQYQDARAAHARAERAHRRRMPLEDTDVNLLALGPMSLLEPGPVRPVIARHDPMSVVGTAVMRTVVR